MEFPRMVHIRQRLKSAPLEKPIEALEAGFVHAGFEALFNSGQRVAIAVGSRRITGIAPLLERLASRLDNLGCTPFLAPAMGSHGGATPEGQEKILYDLGISEMTTGARVVSSMETVRLGETPGGAVAFIDKTSMGADAIIVINKVAPHTGYSGHVQSGVVKMLAVGLGNQDGARSLHKHGFSAGHLIGEMADTVLSKAPVVMAIAIVEDGAKDQARIEVLGKGEIRNREPDLLKLAISMWPAIPVKSADILIIDEMGKEISGTGMDPLVTGRGKHLPPGEAPCFSAKRLVVLGLTPASNGNATGMGHADITTRRLYLSVDFGATIENVLTSGALERARVPIVANTDSDAVEMALASLGEVDPGAARVVRIKNTRDLGELQVSETIIPELEVCDGIEIIGAEMMRFNRQGRLGG